MTEEVRPPEGDQPQDRHRFYGQVASALNNNTAALGRAFDVIKELQETMKVQNDLLRDMRTTGRVLMAVLVISMGSMGWYINRVVSSADAESAKVERHDRTLELHDLYLKSQQPLQEQLTYIKSRLQKLEETVESRKK